MFLFPIGHILQIVYLHLEELPNHRFLIWSQHDFFLFVLEDAAQIQQALAQQRLDKFRQDPTSDAGYKAQMDQILEAKRRVAAARGVRFNPEAEQGALGAGTLAALAQNQMNYDKNYQNDRNSYFGPAGRRVYFALRRLENDFPFPLASRRGLLALVYFLVEGFAARRPEDSTFVQRCGWWLGLGV